MSNGDGGRVPRRFGVALAVIPVLAVVLADVVIAARAARPTTHRPATHAAAPRHTDNAAPDRTGADRTLAIRDLLARRAAAVLHHDAAAFAATADPEQPAFVAQQRRELAAMRPVPLAQWSYEIDTDTAMPSNARTSRYGAPTWAPQHFTLHYEIRGFDTAPTSLNQFPTFVHRARGWFIASFDDFTAQGHRSDVDVWDFGPVRVARAPGVLVLGHPSSQALLRSIAVEASSAIPQVSAVWRMRWPRRVVVLVPSTQTELARVVDDTGDLSQIAAVASAEVQDCPGPPEPVGNRVAINPRNWTKLSPLGRRIVLTHELTHVATRIDTGSCTPTWLVEGFADYIGYLGSGVPVPVVAQELAADVRHGRVPTRLPPDADFAGSSKRLAQAYEGSWLACRLIVATWGQSRLVRLYRAIGTSRQPPQRAVADAMGTLLHTTPAGFVAMWRAYLREQLS